MKYKLNFNGYELKLKPTTEKRVKLIDVTATIEDNKLRIIPLKKKYVKGISEYYDPEGHRVNKVYKSDGKVIFKPYERTTKINKGQFEAISKIELMNLIPNQNFYIVSGETTELIKALKKDVAYKFIMSVSTGYKRHIALMYFNGSCNRIEIMTGRGWKTDIKEDEEYAEVEMKDEILDKAVTLEEGMEIAVA